MSLIFVIWLFVAYATHSEALGTSHLNVTAIVSDEHGDSRFQCWQIAAPFKEYPTAGGQSLTFDNVRSDVHLVQLPPHSEEGIHNARYAMIFVLLSGRCHVWLPNKSEDFWLGDGHPTFMVAADVEGFGHYTAYPTDRVTTILQIPFEDGILPDHTALSNSTCHDHVVRNGLLKDDSEDDIARQIWFTEQGLLQPFL